MNLSKRIILILFIAAESVMLMANGGAELRKRADSRRLAQEGLACLQRGRETGDGEAYRQAEMHFRDAIDLDDENVAALTGLGIVNLNGHRFAAALDWGRKSLDINPHKAFSYGVVVDALVELGRYEEAVHMAQRMADLRPDLSAYSRISYLRELHGDMEGAISALQSGIHIGSGHLENINWCRVQLGHLYFETGQLDPAGRQYQEALYYDSTYAPALAGRARIEAVWGDYPKAIYLYLQALETRPIGEYIIALGKVYRDAGMTTIARRTFADALHLLHEEKANGMDVDDELADLLMHTGQELDEALKLAQAVHERRNTVNTAALLAEAYYLNADYRRAADVLEEALTLGTRYAQVYYLAGLIYQKIDPDKSTAYLQTALEINPYFSAEDVRTARRLLAVRRDG